MICRKATILQAKKRNGVFQAKQKFFDFPAFWLNNPGHLLLAGVPDRVHRRQQRLQAGGPGRPLQGEVVPRPVRIGCSGWNYQDWRGRVYPEACPPAAGSSTTRRCSTPSRSTPPSTGSPSPTAVARWLRQTPHGLRLRGQGQPLHDPHEAPARPRAADASASTTAIAPLADSPKLGPVLWQLPERKRVDVPRLEAALDALPPGRHASSSATRAGSPTRCSSCCASTASRSSIGHHPERPWQPLELTDRLDVRALPLRRARPARQLLRDRAARVGAARARAGASAPRCSPTSTTTGRASRRATRCGCGSSWNAERMDDDIRYALEQTTTWAVVGCSPDPRPRLAPHRRAAAAPRLPRDPGQPGGRRDPRRALLPERSPRSASRIEVVDLFRRSSRGRRARRRGDRDRRQGGLDAARRDRRRRRPRGPARRACAWSMDRCPAIELPRLSAA